MTDEQQWMDTVDPVEMSRRDKPKKRFCLTILYHPNPNRVGERAYLFEHHHVGPVALSRLEPLFFSVDGSKSEPLASLCISRRATWLSPAASGGVLLAPDQQGTEVVADGLSVLSPREYSATKLDRGVVLELARRVVVLLHTVGPPLSIDPPLGFVGHSESMEQVRSDILKVADLQMPILLRGETGVGKELAASAIHNSSQRANQPFVSVNIAAVPPSIAASELFGHAEGAFTGAVGKHQGYFQQAHRGTLFLDEVGATPQDVQAMLLRALETREVQPVGAHSAQPVDVRVIAATDEDLEQAVEAGRFRAPLYHRLSCYSLTIPPLRERRDDIGRLLIHFLQHELDCIGETYRIHPLKEGQAPWLPASLIAKLVSYDWPGNVRQLHNVVRQLVISNRGSETVQIEPDLLDFKEAPSPHHLKAQSTPAKTHARDRRSPSKINEEDLIAALRANQWRIGATATQLGISRVSLYALIERSDRIRKAKDLTLEQVQQCQKECGCDLEAMSKCLEVSERGLKLRMKELGLL